MKQMVLLIVNLQVQLNGTIKLRIFLQSDDKRHSLDSYNTIELMYNFFSWIHYICRIKNKLDLFEYIKNNVPIHL